MNKIAIFDIWGQRCQTVFDENSELEPMVWFSRMAEKGWLMPIEIRLEDGTVLHSREELEKILGE